MTYVFFLKTYNKNIFMKLKTSKHNLSNSRLLEYVSKKLKVISCLETSPDSNDVYFQRYQKWKLVFDIIRGKKQIQTYFDLALVSSLILCYKQT